MLHIVRIDTRLTSSGFIHPVFEIPYTIHEIAIIDTAIDMVFTKNLSLNAILGAEYIIPIDTNDNEMRRLKILDDTSDNAIPKELVLIMNIHACNFDTSPDGIGRFFPFNLSKSASTKSLKTYIPIIMNKELSGNVTIPATV